MPKPIDATWMHPHRQAWLSHLQWLWASYLGGEAFLAQSYPRMLGSLEYDEAARNRIHRRRKVLENTMLRRHERERDEHYAQRLDFATPINFVRPLTDTIASAVTKTAIATMPEGAKELMLDVDLEGTSLSEFRRQVAVIAATLGTDFVLIDRTRAPVVGGERPPSMREERDAGVRTFVRHVTPIDLVHWSWDAERRQFEWALVREHAPYRSPAPLDGLAQPVSAREQYIVRLFHPGGWRRFVDGAAVDEGPRYWPQDLGGAPLVPVAINREPGEAEPHGTPEIADVAALQRLVFNVHSWYIDDLFNNAFHQVVLDTDEEIVGDADREFGPATWIRGKGGVVLSPNPAVFEHMTNAINFHVMLARARLGLDPGKSDAPESGVALALRRENFDAFLSGFATALEGAEQRWLRAFVAIQDSGAGVDEVTVRYGADFTQFVLDAQLEGLLNTWREMGTQLPPEAKAEIQKAVLRAVVPDIDEPKRAELDGAVEKWAQEDEPEPAGGGFGAPFTEDAQEEEDDDAAQNGGDGGAPGNGGGPVFGRPG